MTDPIVRTTAGDVLGVWRDGSAAFYGIPFAAAPVGELRFAAPAPAPAWEDVRSAIEPGPTPQRRPFAEVTSIPEPSFPGDATLNVNVFTPAPGEPDARLPSSSGSTVADTRPARRAAPGTTARPSTATAW